MKFTIYDLRFTPRSSRGEEPLTHSFLTGRTASDVQPFQPPVRSKPLRRIDASTLQPGFTLIELLVVIAIAVVISALLITAGAAVVRKSNINRAISEREQIETAIDNYHATFGYYPPSNPNGPLTNQLYYELLGTSTNATGFETLDDASQISAATVQSTFGVSAFMNCNKGSGEDAVPAHMFLAGLKSGEIASNGNWNVLVTAANSDAGYTPMPGVYSLAGRPANPWRYVCPGTNNSSSYDLWVQVFVGNKTNLICNWAKQPEFNVPLP